MRFESTANTGTERSESNAFSQVPIGTSDLRNSDTSHLARPAQGTPAQKAESYGFPSSSSLLATEPSSEVRSKPDTGSDAKPLGSLEPQLDTTPREETKPVFQTIQFDRFEIHRYPNTSDAFVKNAEERIASMPENEKQFLRAAGLKISLCDQLKDVFPDQESFDERGGAYSPETNQIAFAQRKMQILAQSEIEGSGAKVGHMGKPSDSLAEHTMYHEWGHALNESIRSASDIRLDASTNRFSDSATFTNPYTAELLKTNLSHHKDYEAMHYFDSDSPSMSHNRNEAFAEMYVILRGRENPKIYPSDALLPKDFARTYNAEKTKLEELFGTTNDKH